MDARRDSRRLATMLLAVTVLGSIGCATHRYDAYGNPVYGHRDHRHATEGAILGGLAGAGVGRMIAGHDDDEAGYWIGGALGAITGAVIGDAMDREHTRRAPEPHRYPDVPPPGHGRRHGPDYDEGYDDHDGHDDDWDAYDRRSDAEPRILSLPDEVLFAAGSDRLERGAKRRLRDVAQALRRHPGTVAVVRGHSSRREGHSAALSEARARVVRDYLVREGIAPSRVTALGMGARFPVASDRTADGRQRNRRAEIELHSRRGHELAGLW